VNYRAPNVLRNSEKMSRKKSIDITNLPEVPQIPSENSAVSKKSNALIRIEENNDQLVTMLTSLKEREESLYENVKNLDNENVEINQAAEMSTNITNNKNNNNNVFEEECRDYIAPLMSRTQATISTLLATKESLDQLDHLHHIIHQLLTVQEQNYQMRKRLKTVKTLNALKEMEIQVSFMGT